MAGMARLRVSVGAVEAVLLPDARPDMLPSGVLEAGIIRPMLKLGQALSAQIVSWKASFQEYRNRNAGHAWAAIE